ncbi:BlaI/MecI/CopY family transcriptional regulator [Priestia megaterium]|uniref:BlaI/MecI/CopY family transcriptional regulator n=1 Tax=Priestia megaterium TaxID=1404 RepID=UPI002448827D|nr:BlaI/MecI/CopY family transcriptional regulator [Priestia megaterium]MDH2363189.1 BlaI/MecI/CopY family transcriptional regulator [Priestia megaterium]
MDNVSEKDREILLKILGPLELEVMKIIWLKQEATVQQVLMELNKDNGYAYTTIMTVMNRLNKKEILTYHKLGKVYVYSPVYDSAELIRRVSSEQVESLLVDYGDLAITQFVDAIGHNPNQLHKLKMLIKQLERDEQ